MPSRRSPRPRRLVALALTSLTGLAGATVVAVPPASAEPMTFTVNTTGNFASGAPNGICDVDVADGRQCNLRDAINEANANPGVDTIAFNLPSPYVNQINASVIPITDPVVIDGTTQPGYNPSTGAIVRLDGTNTSNGNTGLTVNAGGSGTTIKGLAFTRWGQAIRLVGNDNVVANNYIGLLPTGTATTLGNSDGVRVVGNDNVVGGSSAGSRNVIGYNSTGVNVFNETYQLTEGVTDDNQVLGNFIGVRTDGSSTAPNYYGIQVTYADGTAIGAADAGNVISGNDYMGINVQESTTTDVVGNTIGMSSTETNEVPNNYYGVYTSSSGLARLRDNLIGGNRYYNAYLNGGRLEATDNILGSATPVDVNTTNSYASGLVANSLAGGLIKNNTVAGNYYHGLDLSYSNGMQIVGNKIGTDPTGASAVPNGQYTGYDGIRICGGSDTRLGTRDAAESNVISGNGGYGVHLTCDADETLVLGNTIGRAADGTTPIPNNYAGLHIESTDRSQIGDGTAAGSNLVASNNGTGILVTGTSVSNSISRNVVTDNQGPAIDLQGPSGPDTVDAGDGDGGPNGLQNFPVLTQAGSDGSSTTIKGTLNSRPGRDYRLEYYANDACDSSGYGEAQRYLGSRTVTTNSQGNAIFVSTLPDAIVGSGEHVTATATDVRRDDTSELSACVGAIGLPTASIDDVTTTEGNTGSTNATFTVTLSEAPTVVTTVRATTEAGTAASGTDFTAVGATVTFQPGETTKTVTVPVRGDVTDEFDETYSVKLSVPDNVTLADDTGQGTITDNDAEVAVSLADVRVNEPVSGSSNATVVLRLSRFSGKPVTVTYGTASGSATGADYSPRTATVTIPAGATSRNVNVPVRSDLIDESEETFYLNLSSPTNATIADDQGAVTIADSDPTRTISVNDVNLSEGNAGAKIMTFTVSLSGKVSSTVTVGYTTVDGTAVAPEDYSSASGTLAFNPGTTSRTVSLTVNGDSAVEPNEDLFLELSGPINAEVADASGRGSIRNDD